MFPRFLSRALMLTIVLGIPTAAPAAGQSTGIRDLPASPDAMILLHTRLRVSTTIELPADDDIAYVVCGDPLFWVIDTKANIAHVRPAKDGAATDLKLLTKRGRKHVFWLAKQETPAMPDVWVRVVPDTNVVDQPSTEGAESREDVRAELIETSARLEAATQRSTEAIATFQQQYPTQLQFVYGTFKYKKPFLLRAVWHDGRFTYLQTDAPELPAIYEVQDGKPTLVNFQVQGTTYVVPKVLERGYLALGDARLSFAQQGRR